MSLTFVPSDVPTVIYADFPTDLKNGVNNDYNNNVIMEIVGVDGAGVLMH